MQREGGRGGGRRDGNGEYIKPSISRRHVRWGKGSAAKDAANS